MRVTIAIATWNRSGLLKQTLASLQKVRIPTGVTGEIWVCDNNSHDDTRQVVEQAKAERLKVGGMQVGGMQVGYLFEGRQGKSYALNRLVGCATGEWILFLDDDVLVDEGWLEGYVQAIKRYPEAGCLGGAIEPWVQEGENYGKWRVLMEYYPAVFGLLHLEADRMMVLGEQMGYGGNMVIRRDVLGKEPFDIWRGVFAGKRIAGEDVGIQEMLLSQGYVGWLVAQAKVKHYVPAKMVSLKRLWQWQKAIGAGWRAQRGEPTRGKLGVAWWAWKEMLRRSWLMVKAWRGGTVSREYAQRIVEAAQWWGYLRG